jgi:hypothetical protein
MEVIGGSHPGDALAPGISALPSEAEPKIESISGKRGGKMKKIVVVLLLFVSFNLFSQEKIGTITYNFRYYGKDFTIVDLGDPCKEVEVHISTTISHEYFWGGEDYGYSWDHYRQTFITVGWVRRIAPPFPA